LVFCGVNELKAPSDLVGRYMTGHSIQKCLGNILASSGNVLREIIPTIPVLLFLIIIGYQFGQQKFLIKDLACVSDTCGNHGERGLGTRLRYPRGRRILASPSSRVVFFPATLTLVRPLCTCRGSVGMAVQTLSSFLTFFWTMYSLFLRAARVKFNWLLSKQWAPKAKKILVAETFLVPQFIIQLSYTVRVPIFWLSDLYHVILGCDETTTLTSLSWCNSRGIYSTHHWLEVWRFVRCRHWFSYWWCNFLGEYLFWKVKLRIFSFSFKLAAVFQEHPTSIFEI